MDVETTRAFAPDYAIVPGETLLDVLSSLGLTQSELAERSGRPKKTINEIINGKAAITPETALQFERVLGVPASFWNGLEQNYRAMLARIAEQKDLQLQVEWLKTVPVNALIKQKWIEKRANRPEQLSEVLSFFGVASTSAWTDVWTNFQAAVAFRQSALASTDLGTAAAWLRKGELKARDIRCAIFDAAAFRKCLSEIRALTSEIPSVFQPQVIEKCAAVGVAVCFVPELPKLRVSGATRWLSADKAQIQLSLRYKTDDQLWFTFFHEAGHILLHGKRTVFVEDGHKGGTTAKEEGEANRFARDMLIPPDEIAAFVRDGDFSAFSIKGFAKSIGVGPGIVVGRLQHDNKLPWETPFNRVLKRRFVWAASS
jgi:HTH-type transcriptional regulator/antitoxin HigA